MTHTLTIVSHTHWDREWYQPFQEFRIRLVQLVDRLLDLLERDTAYRHFMLDGQTIVLQDYLEIRPGREQQLRRHVQEGRLLIGPWYVLPDEFLVSPEAAVRNLILGDRVSRRFGPKMNLGYVPDSFGHIAQLPQILRGFGMDTAVIWRGVGEAPNEFLWQAPDGSQVLTIHLRSGYGNAAHLPDDEAGFREHLAAVAAALAPFATTQHLLAMNGTDHQEPQPELARLSAQAQGQLPDLELRHGTLPQFVAAVREAQPVLEVRRGEMRSPARAHLLPGVFSARMWIKQRNAHCEMLLEKWAEPFSALAAAHGLETPTRDLAALCWEAWRLLIQNHPHDSICGCSVDAVHKEMDVRFDGVEQIGEEVTRQSLAAIAAAVDARTLPGEPVVVFNPAAGPRTDRVTARVSLPVVAEAVEVLDAAGEPVPCEIVRREQPPATEFELGREDLLAALAMLSGGTFGEEAVQDVQMAMQGDLLTVDVALGPPPPAQQVIEAAVVRLRELLGDPSLRRVRARLHHIAELEVCFVAPDVPGHGYKAFSVRRASRSAPSAAARQDLVLENEYLLVEADPASGTLTLTDKAGGRVFSHLHRFVDGGDRGDEYNYCRPEQDRLVTWPAEPPSCRLVADGPVCQTLEIAQCYRIPAGLAADRTRRSEELVRLPITTRASLTAGVPRVEFVTTVENQAADHRLRVHFPTPIQTAVSHAEGHFDVLARPLALPDDTGDWPEQPVPTVHQRTFVDVSDGDAASGSPRGGRAGLLLANRGLPEVELMPGEEGVTVALTLLRCVGWLSRGDMHCRSGHAGPGLATPGAQCPGSHRFEYALVPHSGGWMHAYAQAHAFSAPLRAVAAGKTGGPLPLALSFAHAEPPGFVLTAVKMPEHGPGLIVRGFNITDAPLQVTLHLGRQWRRAARVRLDETSLDELPMDGSVVRFAADPKQVVTIRFEE